MLETMFKNNNADGTTTAATAAATTASVPTTPPARANVTCFKYNNLGHYATACPDQSSNGKRGDGKGPIRCYGCQGFGHMARSCPKAAKKEDDTARAENVRGIQGPNTRQMKDLPVYLKAYLGTRAVSFLVDTGCERSVAPRKLTSDEILKPAECRSFAANGTVINVVGEVTMNILIGDLILPTPFVVSDSVTEPMLGVEWLRCNRMIWDFTKNILLVNGKIFLLIPGEKNGMCRCVVVSEKVTVPARSQAIVPGRVEMNRMSSDSEGGVWTTEVSELKKSVNVALAILPERLDDLPILVLNCSDEPCEILEHTILAELSLAKCAKKLEDKMLTTQEGGQSYAPLSKLLNGVDTGVTEQQPTELVSTLREYAVVLSIGELDLGETSLAAYWIDTGDAMPIRQTLRRQLFHLLDKIDENVQNMLKAGCSPWTSNIVVVIKKDGSLLFFVDYRKLNSVMRGDAYPLPRIDSCLDAFSGVRFFSGFDLRASYHQVPMNMRDADKTTFIVVGRTDFVACHSHCERLVPHSSA